VPVGSATGAGQTPTLAIAIPRATASALGLVSITRVTVSTPTALVSGVAIIPDIPALGLSVFDVPAATVTGLGLTPAPQATLGVPLATGTAQASAPVVTPLATPILGSVTSTALAPTLVLAVPSSSASAVGLTPAHVCTVSTPASAATAQGLTPVSTTSVLVPVAGSPVEGAIPSPAITISPLPASVSMAGIAPTLPVTGVVNATSGSLTFRGGVATMAPVVIVTAGASDLTLGTNPAEIRFGQTVMASAGEIVLGGAHTRLSKDGDGDLSIAARFEDLDTGQEMVTIENEVTGETWTRPSKLMHIYRMGYGDKWREAKLFPAPTGRV
jgi:hypothetical protein